MKQLSSQDGYDRYAPHYRKDHSHLDSFDWDLCRPLIKAALDPLPRAVLDAGCGDGRVLKRLVKLLPDPLPPGFVLEGRDISAGMLAQARKALPAWVRLVQADICDPRPGGKGSHAGHFDLALAFFVLVHVPRPGLAFQALASWLNPGGRLICNSFPQKEAPVLEEGGHKFQIEFFDHSAGELLEAAALAGLELEQDIQGPWSRVFSFRKA